jgi:hypothetical protein
LRLKWQFVLTMVLLVAFAGSAQAKPGSYIVGDSSESAVYRVNSKTGAKTTLSDDSDLVAPNDSAIAANGMIYVADYNAFGGGGGVFKLNPRTRNLTTLSDSELFDQPDGIALGPDGDLYVTDLDAPDADGGLFRVSLPGGATELVSDDPLLESPVGVVVPPDGHPIVSNLDGDPIIVRVDPDTGTATTIADAADDGLLTQSGVALAPNGKLYMSGGSIMQRIDPVTGTVTDAGGNAVTDNYGLAFDWFRGAVVSTDGEDLFAKVPGQDANRELDTNFNYSEGIEVEPPRCGRKTATIVGTNRKDRITGSRFGDVIATLDGNDVVKGGAGKDVICTGDGRDKINGGAGKDKCKGEAGRDRERKC